MACCDCRPMEDAGLRPASLVHECATSVSVFARRGCRVSNFESGGVGWGVIGFGRRGPAEVDRVNDGRKE